MAVEGAAAVSAAHEAGRGADRRGLPGRDQHAGSVKRALFGLFQGAVGKDVVRRAWRKVKVDRDAWCGRSLAGEDIVRLILDATVIRTRLDRKATNISVLAAIGVRRDGQKILIRHMGGESTAAWRQFLDDLDARGLKRPDFVIVDGAPGLEAALTALRGAELPIQRCTVHKHRNLLGHAPKRLHDELTEESRDMIYAETAAEVDGRSSPSPCSPSPLTRPPDQADITMLGARRSTISTNSETRPGRRRQGRRDHRHSAAARAAGTDRRARHHRRPAPARGHAHDVPRSDMLGEPLSCHPPAAHNNAPPSARRSPARRAARPAPRRPRRSADTAMAPAAPPPAAPSPPATASCSDSST